MKATAFFAVVFLSMLGLFIVATGEFKHWFSDSDEGPGRIRVSKNIRDGDGGKNYLDFDFWNVKLGRRNFTLRAELPRDDLKDAARIDELENLNLRNGTIDIPIYEGDGVIPAQGDKKQPRGLILKFESAIYHRSGGLVKGSGLVTVTLKNGNGTTQEGTEFYFEELLFKNETEASEKTRFILSSRKAVYIKNPYLEVHSPAGLEGHSGSSGMEILSFHAPVYTYIDPDVAGGLTLSEAGQPSSPSLASKEKVVITCGGSLDLEFSRPPREKGGRESTFITFKKDVKIFQGVQPEARGGPPTVGNTRFECQKLELEIDDRRKNPTPRRALATWEGGRVRATVARGARTYLLSGEKLEWVNVAGAAGGAAGNKMVEGVLTGRPTLQGPDVDFIAERAIMRPQSEKLFLQDVSGSFKMTGSEGSRGKARARAEQFVKQAPGQKPAVQGDGKTSAARDELDQLDFDADEVEVAFNADGKKDEGGGTLSHFIARSDQARGVVLRSRGWRQGKEGKGAPSSSDHQFQAAGKTLTYQAGLQQATLEGTERELPRLSQGSSWVEARKINLIVDGGPEGAWFEGSVSAKVDMGDFRPEDASSAEKKDKQNPPAARVVEIQSDYLGLLFEDGKTLQKAFARGDGIRPVRLTTRAGGLYRFSAPEVQLLTGERVFELIGTAEQRAKLEKEGGVVLAGKIRFEQESRQCVLADGVEVRLYSGDKITNRPDLLIQAARADVEFEQAAGEQEAEGGLLRNLRSIKALNATAGEKTPLTVSGKIFEMRGEKAAWDSTTRRLRFFGNGLQAMQLDHEELQGPVRAREIVYDEQSNSVTLRSEVKGELGQRARQEKNAEGAARNAGSKMAWEFETNELELRLSKEGNSGPLQLTGIQARDKVLLYNRAMAILLRGDDLVYDRAQSKVRVFSRDGRRQTLQHFKDGLEASGALGGAQGRAQPVAERVDTIDAQEIEAFLYEAAGDSKDAPARQMVVVGFKRNVMANFFVPGKSASPPPAEPGAGKHWQVVAQRLTLHVNPTGDASAENRLPWAAASNLIGTQGGRGGGNVTINTGPYQAYAERVEYRSSPRRLMLVGGKNSPATIADRRPQKRRAIREQAPVIIIRKPKDEIELEYLSRVPGEEPWPGVPEALQD